MIDPYTNLGHFFGSYFHQDWNATHADYHSVLLEFIRENPKNVSIAAASELRFLLSAETDDEKLSKLVQDDLLRYYHPGQTRMRKWLTDVLMELDRLTC